MTRDELIEELKKIPSNSEVKIKIKPRSVHGPWGSIETVRSEFLVIDRVTTIPDPIIEAV